ncbi:MAG: hypothetical protein WCE38_12630 [Burkholderiales bacterium]
MKAMNDAGTVLIVDDEPLYIDLLEQQLGAVGYRTVSAASGEQALALAVEADPDLSMTCRPADAGSFSARKAITPRS